MNEYFESGKKKCELSDYEGAIRDLTEAIKLEPQNAVAYNKRSTAKSKLNDYEGAIKDLDKAINIDPQYAAAYNNRGVAKSNLKDYKGALIDFNECIKLAPQYANAYNNRGFVKGNLNDNNGALIDYNEAIALDPQLSSAFNNRGIIKSNLKDYEGAILDFNEAIKLDPLFTLAFNNRGNAKSILKDYESALIDFDEAIKLDTQYAAAYYNRGNLKKNLKDFKGAIKDYDKAISLNPQYTSAYNNRGLLKRDLKLYSAALNDFKKALKYEPDNQRYISNIVKTNKIIEDTKFITEQKKVEMQNIDSSDKFEGYLAFADILGWKGIWQKAEFKPVDTLENMLKIKNTVNGIDTDKKLIVNLISDTFVIFSDDIDIINKACLKLIESCLEAKLLVRGAISYGLYYNRETVYVGPAVDEAASWHEKAEELAIFYTTSARKKAQEPNLSAIAKCNLVEREVNIKQGKILTYAINWYSKENEQNFMKIMNENQVYPELYSKYNNTEMYINECVNNITKNKKTEDTEDNKKQLEYTLKKKELRESNSKRIRNRKYRV